MQYGSHLWISPKAVVCGFAKPILHVVGSFPVYANGCGCGWVCIIQSAQGVGAGIVGAGLAFAERGWQTIPAGTGGAAGDPGRFKPACGRALGDGGGFALQGSVRCGRRNVGRPARLGFYGNQAAGIAGGTTPGTLLADPADGLTRPECCAQPLARDIPAITATSGRRQGPWSTALAGRAFPVASSAARHMDRNL